MSLGEIILLAIHWQRLGQKYMVCTVLLSFASRLQGLGCLLTSPNSLL